ncbi:MAG: hypothetical protein ABL908_09575 [Hyphomicrobium sp.]
MGTSTDTDNTPTDLMLDDDIEIEIVSADERDEAAEPVAAEPAKKAADVEPQAPEADDMASLRAELVRERAARERAERDRDDGDSRTRAALAASEAREVRSQRESAQNLLDATEVKIKAAREALKLAKRDGNHDLEVEAQEMLEKLRDVKSRVERDIIEKLPTDDDLRRKADDAAKPTARSASNDAPAPRNSLAQQWASGNPNMMSGQYAQAVQFMSAQIHQEGINPDDPAHFAELTKRLGAAFPKAGVKGIASAPRNAAPPVAGARSAASPKSSNPNKVKLDANDFALMRRYKMDPKDQKAQRAYAKAKRDLALEDQSRPSNR